MVAVLIRACDGEIKSYNYKKVKLAKPDPPVFVTKKITSKTKKITIRSNENVTATLCIGKDKYKTKKIAKKKKKNGVKWYYYTFEITNPKAGKKVIAYVKNKTGYSKKVKYGKVK